MCVKTIDASSEQFGVPPKRAFALQFLHAEQGDCFDRLAGEGYREKERQFLLTSLAPKNGDR